MEYDTTNNSIMPLDHHTLGESHEMGEPAIIRYVQIDPFHEITSKLVHIGLINIIEDPCTIKIAKQLLYKV